MLSELLRSDELLITVCNRMSFILHFQMEVGLDDLRKEGLANGTIGYAHGTSQIGVGLFIA
jgi:hypothetical protein